MSDHSDQRYTYIYIHITERWDSNITRSVQKHYFIPVTGNSTSTPMTTNDNDSDSGNHLIPNIIDKDINSTTISYIKIWNTTLSDNKRPKDTLYYVISITVSIILLISTAITIIILRRRRQNSPNNALDYLSNINYELSSGSEDTLFENETEL
jgi:hypothetical protein